MKLSEHFELDEFVVSQTATRQGIDNTPNNEQIANLKALCEHLLEPLRAALGPVSISSGFRCLALNRAIGGVDRPGHLSAHTEGKAADLSVKGKTLAEVYNWLQANAATLGYDQIIREFPPGGWVHISFDPAKTRRENLLAIRGTDGKTAYSVQNQPVRV